MSFRLVALPLLYNQGQIMKPLLILLISSIVLLGCSATKAPTVTESKQSERIDQYLHLVIANL